MNSFLNSTFINNNKLLNNIIQLVRNINNLEINIALSIDKIIFIAYIKTQLSKLEGITFF